MTILAVTGLTKEAEIVGIEGVVAVSGGGDAAGLAAKLDALHGDIAGVISIGLAGALSPHLKVGDVVIADRIYEPILPFTRVSAQGGEVPVAGRSFAVVASEGRRGEYRCDGKWRVALAARIPHAHQGSITASEGVVDTAEAKAALFQASGGALAVDMESAVAARFAAQRGVRLAALRVISDAAHHAVPEAALVAMNPDGGIAAGRVLWSLVKNPLQLGSLIRLARGSSRAFAELLRCRDLCGRGLAGLDL